MFFFEQMFNTAVNGVVAAGLMSTMLTVAYGILLASLLLAAYEAWTKGGDVRAFGVSAVKYLALGLLFDNDGATYNSIFRSVVGAFNQMAHAMAGAGPSDVLGRWLTELWTAASGSATFLNLVTGGAAAILSAALLLIAMILYPIAYMVFAVLYCLFGTILYVAGPLVLALLPSLGLGGLARRYATNLVIFAGWGLIYGVFCRVFMILNIDSMAAIMGAGSFAGALAGASAEVLLAAASILFSVCILLIPLLAKRIVEGDLGSASMMVLAAANGLIQSTASLMAGPASGYGRTSAGGADGGATAASGVSGGGRGSSGAMATASSGGAGGAMSSESKAPSGPSGGGGGRGMGDYRPMNVPHAIGWLAGAAAALGVQGGKWAAETGRGMVSKASGEPAAKATPSLPASGAGATQSADEWV